MKVEIVNPPFFVKPVGYAHMSRVAGPTGTVLLLGGVTGMDDQGVITHPDDLVAQMDQALINIKAAVEYAGGRVEDIARIRIFTSDMDGYRANLGGLGRAWKRHFGQHYPAMALLGLKDLFDPQAKIEIECEAFLPQIGDRTEARGDK
jgi:enamine deaminase RidA (YjgF/YER057c/UK114 family)